MVKDTSTDPGFLAPHVAELDADSRAILDLSLRYGFSDERLAPLLQMGSEELALRREEALFALAESAGLDPSVERGQLEQALREVPHETWLGREIADPVPEPDLVAAPEPAVPPPPTPGSPERADRPWPSRRSLAALLGLIAVVAVIALVVANG